MNRIVSTRSHNMKFKFSEGERVLCFEPDPTKARVLYDAKILEIRVKKDVKGKKAVEYLIHFQGWNTSWDRFVPETYILHDVEENRLLQKELADTARSILKRRKRIGASLKGAEPKPRTDSESSCPEDADSCTRSSFNEEMPEEDENMETSECQNVMTSESEIAINIPDSIKQFLEDDFINVKYNRKIVRTPCEPNVVSILEGFLRHFTCSLTSSKGPEKTRASNRANSTSSNTSSNAGDTSCGNVTNITLCKEVIDGLRVSFDFLFSVILLYPEERIHYHPIKRKSTPKESNSLDTPQSSHVTEGTLLLQDAFHWRVLPDSTELDTELLPCSTYGVVHLSRLLVKLPEILKKMHLPEEKQRIVVNYSEILLQYLAKQSDLITQTVYVPIKL